MHFAAEHALFFERRQPFWLAASSLPLTACVLIVNAGAGSTTVSLVLAGIGAVLLLAAQVRGHRRIEPALAWGVSLVALVLLVGVVLNRDAAHALRAGARVSCGVVWILWLGTRVDWASLRRILLGLRVPERAVATIDHTLMHGVLTQRGWARRRDAARLRLGSSRLPLAAWGPLLGEGALQAFVRLERVEEGALLRSSANASVGEPLGVHVDVVDVERSGQRVLEQIDLRLEPQECVGLCGPSGAGKSSLLRLLAGLDGPARGSVTRFGRAVSTDAPLRERLDGRVALLDQNPEHHFIASTVAEDIAWGLIHRGVESLAARARAFEVAKALRIEHLWVRPCHELSFGEQRRVTLAGLLVVEPALLLLDEPTAGLDPVAAHELRTLVEEFVRRNGTACVWATHDLDALPPSIERIVLLRDGRVVFDGPTAEGLSRPWLLRAGLAVPQEGESPC